MLADVHEEKENVEMVNTITTLTLFTDERPLTDLEGHLKSARGE